MGNNDGKVSKENRIVVPKKGRIVRRSSASALVECVCVLFLERCPFAWFVAGAPIGSNNTFITHFL